MNRSIKEQTVKIYFYETLNEFKRHLLLWLLAYNHQKKLKSLKYHAPYGVMCAEYEAEPSCFREKPTHKIAGLYT
jgi:hypothetical protein